ncbi:MAG: divalent metal cation transporter [Haliea sp.]
MDLLKTCGEKIGPGMLFAASCVGTSHLVQSTRAGADYGFALWWVILLACIIKYPTFYFGSAYAAVTGESLIDSYQRQGRWAIGVFTLELLVTMFIATSAVALITGGLVNSILGLEIDAIPMTGIMLMVSSLLLITGKYHFFERITTLLVVLFTGLILLAVLLAAPKLNMQTADFMPPAELDLKTILFIIAFAGWMPTAMGASVFQSLWVCAKSKDLQRPVTPAEARFDFNLGYIGTALLAFCFLILGVIFMHQEGIETSSSAAGFAGQFMGLFTLAIGEWAYPIIAIASIAIMFSTLLTLMDACPRALVRLSEQFSPADNESKSNVKRYNLFIVAQCLGAIVIVMVFLNSFKTFIDFATSVAFLVAPLMALINHRAMFSEKVSGELKPAIGLRVWSYFGIVTLTIFALCYLYFGVLNQAI